MLFQRSTRFAGLAPRSACIVIAILALAIGYGLITCQPISTDNYNDSPKGEDLRCYRRIVERIHAGEGYYKAAGSELRARGSATQSVFNWRLPVLAWVMGRLPSIHAGQVLAVILASITLLVWINVLQTQCSFGQFMFGSLLLLGSPIYSLSTDIFLAHEFWAGTCIALSLATYIRGWRFASVISGLAGLFLRELTLPFIFVMGVLSYIEGHRRETLVWILGTVAFGVILLFHWSAVTNFVMEGGLAQKEGWIVFGGWSFVLNTARMHPYLFALPPWVTAVIIPLSLLGLVGWCGRLGSRVALKSAYTYWLIFLSASRLINIGGSCIPIFCFSDSCIPPIH